MSDYMREDFGLFDYEDDVSYKEISNFSLFNNDQSEIQDQYVNNRETDNSSQTNKIFLVNNYDFLKVKRKETKEKTKKMAWSPEEVSISHLK
jgi:hypothetical protein